MKPLWQLGNIKRCDLAESITFGQAINLVPQRCEARVAGTLKNSLSGHRSDEPVQASARRTVSRLHGLRRK
jgi:hypothetical protein